MTSLGNSKNRPTNTFRSILKKATNCSWLIRISTFYIFVINFSEMFKILLTHIELNKELQISIKHSLPNIDEK